MKRGKWATLTAKGVALAVLLAGGASAAAQTGTGTPPDKHAPDAVAQTAPGAPPDSRAPMARPPEAASSAGGSSNPDNMPIKRPTKPTNDPMSHEPPASGANAK